MLNVPAEVLSSRVRETKPHTDILDLQAGCEMLLPISDREHNSVEQCIRNCSPPPSPGLTITRMSYSSPSTILLKIWEATRGLKKNCRQCQWHTQDASAEQSTSLQNSPGRTPARAVSLLPLTRVHQKYLHLFSSALVCTDTTKSPFSTWGSRFHLRQGGCWQDGALWAHLPGLYDCVKSCTLLCFTFQHKLI